VTDSPPAGQCSTMATAAGQTSSGAEFRALFSEHYAFVCRSLIHFGLSAASADDVAQEVFLVVHRRLDEFDRTRSFRSWVYGIARRAATAFRRNQERAERRAAHAEPPAGIGGPDQEFEARQRAAWVEKCLRAMPEEQREVFALAEIEALSVPEVAELLSVPLNTVYSRLRLARERFNRAHQRLTMEEAAL
jgi:RNA polymerase sigma-70 factor (ECF subfamily)